MKSPYVSELKPNQVIQTSFLVHSKEIRQKKGGELYLSLLLADRTGELDAKMWDNVDEVLDAFDRDDFVKVKGMIQIFHNRPQMTIHKMRRMDESEIALQRLLPVVQARSGGDVARVARHRRRHAQSASEGAAGGLPGRSRRSPRRYRIAPAAKQIHHAFLGGLIEHVLSVCGWPGGRRALPEHRLRPADHRRVLHDIGKIYELNYERGFSYSNEGQLIGHISIAMRMVGDKLRDLPGFPAAAALAGGAHDPEPPRASWNSGRPSSRSFPKRCCCTTWTIWIPRWNACAR